MLSSKLSNSGNAAYVGRNLAWLEVRRLKPIDSNLSVLWSGATNRAGEVTDVESKYYFWEAEQSQWRREQNKQREARTTERVNNLKRARWKHGRHSQRNQVLLIITRAREAINVTKAVDRRDESLLVWFCLWRVLWESPVQRRPSMTQYFNLKVHSSGSRTECTSYRYHHCISSSS